MLLLLGLLLLRLLRPRLQGDSTKLLCNLSLGRGHGCF